MPPRTPLPPAALPLTGSEVVIMFQGGKGVRATVQGIWNGVATPDVPVLSVNTKTGAVVLSKGDLGLGAVDNTADSAKPVSTAQATALAGKLNTPGVPVSRTVAFGTAYQATNTAKSALVSIMVETLYNVTLAGTQSDTVELRVGPTAATVADGSGGTAIATFKTSLTGIALTVGLANTQRNQLTGVIPPGWYFAVRRVAGTTATLQGAFDQAL